VLSSFGTSITQFYGIRMNGAYDPVLAIGGGQPTYWDYFASLYRKYNVLGSKITVKFGLPLSTTAGDGPYHVGILGSRVLHCQLLIRQHWLHRLIVFTQCWFKEEK